MSGPSSVPLAIAAVFVSSQIAKTLLGITAFVCFWGAAYGVWARERSARNAAEAKIEALTTRRLAILFDPRSSKFVRPNDIQPGRAERYFVALHNPNGMTLQAVTLRAREGEFVYNTIARAHARLTQGDYLQISEEPIIAEVEHLDPYGTEYVELFYHEYLMEFPEDVLQRTHRFELEARARDTPTVVVEFEYNPGPSPNIRMLAAQN
jgi:hypothetical protein